MTERHECLIEIDADVGKPGEVSHHQRAGYVIDDEARSLSIGRHCYYLPQAPEECLNEVPTPHGR